MLSVETTGLGDIEARLDLVSAGLLDLSVPIQGGLEALSEAVLERFLSGGPGWDALKYRSGTPLFDEGHLAEAASAAESGVDGSVYALSPLEGQVGVEDLFEGARAHDLGFDGEDARGRNRDEVSRSFMRIDPDDVVAVSAVFDRYLLSLLD